MDKEAQPLPGATVSIRSYPEDVLIWQGTTGPAGHIHQKIDVSTFSLTVELEGFYTHYQELTIPDGKKCLMVTITKPDPHVVFKVT
jgi:hypothetical protein